MTPKVRFTPYVAPHTRFVEYGNPEPELATSTPVFTQYPTKEVVNHSREASKTTANAGTNKPMTEEKAVTVSIFYCPQIPRVTDWPFSVTPNTLRVQGNHPISGSEIGSRWLSYACGPKGLRTWTTP